MNFSSYTYLISLPPSLPPSLFVSTVASPLVNVCPRAGSVEGR